MTAPRRRRRGLSAASGLALLATLLVSSFALAHPAQYVAANLKVNRDGTFRVHARFDLLAFALNDTPARVEDIAMNELLDGPRVNLELALNDAQQRFIRGVTIQCAESITVRAETVHFPTVEDVYHWRDANVLPRLPVMQEATLEGRLPAGTKSIAIRFPEVLGTLVLSAERPGEEAYSEPLEGGEVSSTLPIALNAAPVTVQAPVTDVNELRAAAKYLALGLTHILPHGLDHVLFVVGLFLLSPKLRPLLWQVTAFTIAHSITLALSLYGVVRLPGTIVEPLIALSIAFIAIENLCTTKLKPWRPAVVFGFGLIHGLGFAGVLREMGLPRSQFATALVSFNIGVECGQLAVLALAFGAVGLFRQRSWYRGAIAMPASFAIAIVAVFWTIQRAFQ